MEELTRIFMKYIKFAHKGKHSENMHKKSTFKRNREKKNLSNDVAIYIYITRENKSHTKTPKRTMHHLTKLGHWNMALYWCSTNHIVSATYFLKRKRLYAAKEWTCMRGRIWRYDNIHESTISSGMKNKKNCTIRQTIKRPLKYGT